MGAGRLQAGSVLGRVQYSGRVFIWVLGGEVVAIRLTMGRVETVLGFSRFGASSSRWLQSGDEALWPYGFGGWEGVSCGPGMSLGGV